MTDIGITRDLRIGEDEISYRFSSSSKPGGQNVNKVSTRVTLLFDVAGSESLSGDQRERIMTSLASRITHAGILRVVCQKHRTQRANRRAALERFIDLVSEALKPRRTRRPTVKPEAAEERRLKDKKHRGRLKRSRTGDVTPE